MIAFDFHTSTKNVLEVGFTMAKAMGAKVVLLHVKINLTSYSLIYEKMDLLQLESVVDIEIAAQNSLTNSKYLLADDMIQTMVKQGDFAVSILDAAKEMAVDIIVMGAHSTKWLEEIVMGRVTNKLLQHSKIPLLIIPTNKQSKVNTFISLENE